MRKSSVRQTVSLRVPLTMMSNGQNIITFTSHSTNRQLYVIAVTLIVITFTSLSVAWITKEVGESLLTTNRALVIDTDPGIDDAVAIFTALGDQSHQVMGITCVRGNTNASNVIINALKILLIADKKVPVFNAFNMGLVESPPTDNWFGEDGFGNLPFPKPPKPTQKEHSATFLSRIVYDNPGQITVVALGPLTNLALALHFNPNFIKQARKVVILGGSIRGSGNVAPGVEFNFFMDPDAARVVLDKALASGTLITIIPLETVAETDLTWYWRWQSLGFINNSVVTFLNQLEMRELELHPNLKEYHPFDAYAMSVALFTDVALSSQKLYGYVENKGQNTNGALVIDYGNITGKPANLEIIMDVDTDIIKKHMFENLSNYKK